MKNHQGGGKKVVPTENREAPFIWSGLMEEVLFTERRGREKGKTKKKSGGGKSQGEQGGIKIGGGGKGSSIAKDSVH